MNKLPVNLASIALSLLGGATLLTAFELNPIIEPSTDFPTFAAFKRAQPVIDEDARWSLIAGGDVMLSRYVETIMDRRGSSSYPFDHVKDALRSSDIAFVNLENPVGSGRWIATGDLIFRADERRLEGMRDAGIGIVSIANNHMSDAGSGGIAATIASLEKYGIRHTGAGRTESGARVPAILDVNGRNVAFLAYGDPRFSNQVRFATDAREGIAKAGLDDMKTDVDAARAVADTVILSLHAGIEYREEPDEFQQTLLDAAVDAGADLVLGHHPHVIQPLYLDGDTWVIASLGNLIFDQMWSEEVRRGMMLRYFFDGDDVTDIEALPIQIFDYAQARPAMGEARMLALQSLRHPLDTAMEIWWDGHSTTISSRAMPLRSEPRTGFTVEKTIEEDLDGDGEGDPETVILRDGRVEVVDYAPTIWRSDADWWVQDVFMSDVDGDGVRNLILSVWKSGNYGPSLPFWVKENDPTVRHHVFVYEMKDRRIVPIWQSSNLPRPNCEMAFADLDGDGIDELIALEGTYEVDASCTATTVSIWKWNQWGFMKEWSSDKGSFWNLRTEPAGSGSMIVVNGTVTE